MISHGIALHGGVGSSTRLAGTCESICRKAFDALEGGGSAFDAVTLAVRLLEDDGRFNAGSGSVLRLDGETIEMDASVMDSTGRIGAVIAVRDVKNPVMVAKAVTETPHIMLAGQGASLFAHRLGLPRSLPVSDRVRRRYDKTKRMMGAVLEKRDARWRLREPEELWNFPRPYGEVFSSDTVGAVAIDKMGRMAVACSTGGASPMLNGRVGDTAILGAGFYVGPLAAIAATGTGEEIMRRMLARTVYDSVVNGTALDIACQAGLESFPTEVPAGLIAMSRDACIIRANRRMASSSFLQQR